MLSSKRSNRVVYVVPFIPSFTINVYLRSEFCVVMSVTISTKKTMFGSSLLPVVCKRVNVLFTLFVFACEVVSNTYCVVFLFCFSLPCVHYGASFSGFSIFDSPNILI